jgi:hypothetical protein
VHRIAAIVLAHHVVERSEGQDELKVCAGRLLRNPRAGQRDALPVVFAVDP